MKRAQVIIGLILGFSSASMVCFANSVSADTYLKTNENYYRSTGIDRGFLDQQISETVLGTDIWNKFQIAVSRNLVTYESGMTFNQYYLANNISPEDNFIVYPNLTNQLVKLSSGAYLNANPNTKGAKDSSGNLVDYVTYVSPTDDRGAYWGDKELEDPVLFSRLTVGNLPKVDNPLLTVFPGGTQLFPTQIGYGESGTVNDYMLNDKNNFIIPTRFNVVRNDVYLTMRSRAYFGAGIQGAQAYLSADSIQGAVVGSVDNPKSYIDTNTNVFLTPQGYDQLGTYSKIISNSVYSNASKTLQKVGIDQFSQKMNDGMKSIQSNSRVNDIVSGNGGQIQLTGFYRESLIDNQYTSDNANRLSDSSHIINVNYYMYTSGNTNQTVTTPLAPNGQHLYSPNVSQFKLETTRPYFTVSSTEVQPIQEKTALADFDNILGSNSITVTDKGISPNGETITIDKDNIKVRVSLDEGKTYTESIYSLSDLKKALEDKTFDSEKITLAYTYSATDADESNVGKLPNEILDNTGAYAVPYIRTLILEPRIEGTVITKYTDTTGKEIAERNTTTGVVGKEYTTVAKTIPGYTLTVTPSNSTGNYEEGIREVTYVYTKNNIPEPVIEGAIITKYVNEDGVEISGQNQTTGTVGTDYSTIEKIIPGYTIKTVPTNHIGTYANGVQTVTYIYSLNGEVPSIIEGTVITKYVDEAGDEISAQNHLTGTVGTNYDTIQKTIPGYTIKTVPNNKTGVYTDGIQNVVYVYKLNDIPNPIIEGIVVTKYIDETGKEISAQNQTTGTVGTNYDTVQKSISGYTLKTIPDNKTGIYSDGLTTVTYIYSKVITSGEKIKGTVVVKYVDEAGNEISSRDVSNGEVGTDYTTNKKTIPGYSFKSVSDNQTGRYQDGVITVIYVYTQDTGAATSLPGNNSVGGEQIKNSANLLPSTGEKSQTGLRLVGLTLIITLLGFVGWSINYSKKRKR